MEVRLDKCLSGCWARVAFLLDLEHPHRNILDVVENLLDGTHACIKIGLGVGVKLWSNLEADVLGFA